VRGPFAIWLRNPKLADAADKFGTTLRNGDLDQRLFEIMVLVVARHWSAQYEWFAHERHARECGISPDVIEAIRHRRKPTFERDDERLVYELVTEMNETRTLSQTPRPGCRRVGLDHVIELVDRSYGGRDHAVLRQRRGGERPTAAPQRDTGVSAPCAISGQVRALRRRFGAFDE
jgi:alkylhydroperoxidase family enzyme